MLYYELKKVWVKPGTKIALLVLAALTAVMCVFAVRDVFYVNENGEREYGMEAARKLRAAKKEWSGTLTEKVISKAIAENIRIASTEEGRSSDVTQSNIAYSWGQGIEDIRWMMVRSYCKFRESDYYAPDHLKPEDAADFYGNRTLHLKEWLDSDEAEYMYSQEEKDFFIEQYEALEVPFEYDYSDGWQSLLAYMSGVVMLVAMTVSFAVAGIFSGEFANKADSVFFVSYHGRKKAVAVKLQAAVILTTLVYWAAILCYSAAVLGILGADGAGVVIQAGGKWIKWKSFYLLTYGQLYLLTVLGGYVGVLFMMLLTMLSAAKTKSTALPVTIPYLLIFLPTFVKNIAFSGNLMNKILGLLPDQLLQVNNAVDYFNAYRVGGKTVGVLGILFALYILLSLILYPLIYQIYRKVEIK